MRPLDRSNVFLLKTTHRPFVEGTGPLPTRRTAGAARAMWILTIAALAAGGVYFVLSLSRRDTFYIYAGVVFVGLSGLFLWFRSRLRGKKMKEDELDARGIIVDGELVDASPIHSTSSYDFVCTYRFTSPRGTNLTCRTAGCRRDISGRTLPPPGTPLVVLYLDDNNFEAL